MVLDYQWSLIRANVSDSEHNQTHASAQLRSSICFSSLRGLQLMLSVVFRCVCLVVCVKLLNIGPKAAISRGEQNRYGWRRRTLLTARLIKFYGGLRLMKSTAAYGGLRRRLGALCCKFCDDRIPMLHRRFAFNWVAQY